MPELARQAIATKPEVAAVLDRLCSPDVGRILRAVSGFGRGRPVRYELFHDVLS